MMRGAADACRACRDRVMALGLSDVTASKRLMTARTLTVDLPALQAALAADEITFWQAPRMRCASRPRLTGSRRGPLPA